MDIIKNPVIIGLTAGILTYFYLKWDIEKHAKKNKKPKDVDLLVPLVVAVIAWFISYTYLDFNPVVPNNFIPLENQPLNPLPTVPIPTQNISHKLTKSLVLSDNKAFSLLNSGINIPNKLPDMLLEMY